MLVNSKNIQIRGLQYHVQEWGDPRLPTLVALHGWMDCGSSFQFMAEHLSDSFHIIAPDLRGFGNTDHVRGGGGYWFPEYIADLEVLLDCYDLQENVNLLGHSMGGNIALLYAGVSHERIAKVMSLDALGLRPTLPDESPTKFRKWLQQEKANAQPKVYANRQELQQSIQKNHPTLSEDVTQALVDIWGKPAQQGGEAVMLKHDVKHRQISPLRYNHKDIIAAWQQVSARVGLVMAAESPFYKLYENAGRLTESRQILSIQDQDYFLVPESGHMLHLEQPLATANCVRTFFISN